MFFRFVSYFFFCSLLPDHIFHQSSEIRVALGGTGTKLWMSIPRDWSSGSAWRGTNMGIKSGRIDNSINISGQVNKSGYVRLETVVNNSFDLWFNSKTFCLPRAVKLNRGGRSLPLGNLVSGLRISSKKGWTMASMGVNLLEGVYSKRWAIKSKASGGVLERKIYNIQFHRHMIVSYRLVPSRMPSRRDNTKYMINN